jgi:hypothetical protein
VNLEKSIRVALVKEYQNLLFRKKRENELVGVIKMVLDQRVISR